MNGVKQPKFKFTLNLSRVKMNKPMLTARTQQYYHNQTCRYLCSSEWITLLSQPIAIFNDRSQTLT